MRLACGAKALDLSRVAIMGILNVTPDSFSDGGSWRDSEQALARARQMVEEGADIIDIGGESTRPGASPVPVEEELRRVVPVIEACARVLPVPLSVDTSKPEVMRAAVEAGAGLINDVRALRVPGALETAAELRVPLCLMHMLGEPQTMQRDPRYADVVSEVREFLQQRVDAAVAAGISAAQLIVDPGFGFGKTVEHNLALLRGLRAISDMRYPVLVGLSRKSLIGQLRGLPVERRAHASIALALLAVVNGARLVRTHDVAPTVDALRTYEAVRLHNCAV